MRKRWSWKILTVMVLLLFTLCLAGERKVSADTAGTTTCSVIFGNSEGKVSNSVFRGWCKRVTKGTVIQLPVTNKTGYRSYWEVQTTAGTKKYLVGSTYTVTGNVRFSLHRYQLRTISFYNKYGNREYTSFRLSLCDGQSFLMPETPGNSTLKGVGWSKTAGSNTAAYTAGKRVRVSGNMKFYGVYVTLARTVYLYGESGVYDTIPLTKGETAVFPCVDTGDGSMMMGWSTVPGMHSNPRYLPGETIPEGINRFYMVVYHPYEETELSFEELRVPEKYAHVYIVGDSRTYLAKHTFGGDPDKVTMIGQPGAGLKWMKGEDPRFSLGGYYQLINALRSNRSISASGQKQAVILNLGVNDMGNIQEYITYMKRVAKVLSNTSTWNCDLYYMSVNPVNMEMYQNYLERRYGVQAPTRTILQVKSFNSKLKTGLQGTYEYIDTFSMLMKSGWCSVDQFGVPDGLHYTKATYQKIYNYCIESIEK